MAMLRLAWIPALLLAGCGDDDCCTVIPDAQRDAPHDILILPDVPNECAGPGREKIKFPREESCGNDGSVEWCIPDNDAQLVATLEGISSTIHCAPGGGRAMCHTGGKLLCFYPTSYPEQCLSQHGQMKLEVWDDICEVAGQPQIIEIVHTLLE
jgi:hypothetical protein